MGVSDPESVHLTGRTFTASALRSLLPDQSSRPDLVVHRSSIATPEYKNPDLFPGMFPTLFPQGFGGFEDPKRPTAIAFDKQAEYFLDLDDRCFARHHAYMFVALNILQRRQSHLHTHFTVSRSGFQAIANDLASLPVEHIARVANIFESEGHIDHSDIMGQRVMKLLSKVRAISAKVPGSQASKLCIRNEIRNYFAYFGMPFLYFTFNPSPVHSPVFQVMYGDNTVDLTNRFPLLPAGPERARRLAEEPVIAADFFQFSFECLFTHLFGWDFKRKHSTSDGGILGHIKAFYGTSE
ncbi:hypothetical protein GGG16DRAFT_66182, partial [Schizophyllum commune]